MASHRRAVRRVRSLGASSSGAELRGPLLIERGVAARDGGLDTAAGVGEIRKGQRQGIELATFLATHGDSQR